MKELLIVFASQDFEQANHKGLWLELSRQTDVLVVNIPADYFTSTLTRKTYRIREAKQGIQKVTDHLSVYRPLLPIRLEVAPDKLFPWIAKVFWKQIASFYNDLESRRIDILAYDGRWIQAMNGTREDLKFAYYLFDEVRNNGRDGSQDAVRTKFDDYACSHADFILTMTKLLADSRSGYPAPKIVIGNGAAAPDPADGKGIHIQRSAAFIGNVRDWIDQELLTTLIRNKPDCLFAFVGSIEDNMRPFVDGLLNRFTNVAYFGRASKEQMTEIYRMFDAVIIPYKDNEFIKATRPIKIVESVLAGTPVVTVPVNGYSENAFIRFASNAESFGQQLDYIMGHPVIEENKEEYDLFVEENTWQKKAEIILNAFKESREVK